MKDKEDIIANFVVGILTLLLIGFFILAIL